MDSVHAHKPEPIDNLFSTPAARADRWRDLTSVAGAWANGQAERAAVDAAFSRAAVIEEFHAFPGGRLMAALRDRIQAENASGAAAASRRISNALLDRSYRTQPGTWETPSDVPEAAAPVVEARARPYFEVLVVTSEPPLRWPSLGAEMHKLRRVEDEFVYEPVFVGSFEDAVCAAAINPEIIAAVVGEGFVLHSRHDAPILRQLMDPALETAAEDATALRLCHVLKRLRPELDLYLVSDRHVEELAGDPAANPVRRIFYAVEEPLELHLAILEGVHDRFQSPFFDNLKAYARRPVGTFHALPIARGKIGVQIRMDTRFRRFLRH